MNAEGLAAPKARADPSVIDTAKERVAEMCALNSVARSHGRCRLPWPTSCGNIQLGHQFDPKSLLTSCDETGQQKLRRTRSVRSAIVRNRSLQTQLRQALIPKNSVSGIRRRQTTRGKDQTPC
jgi:hypothetical protein